jgi:hypothetical protein
MKLSLQIAAMYVKMLYKNIGGSQEYKKYAYTTINIILQLHSIPSPTSLNYNEFQ